MANENETVMSVCAEWRACIESADPSVWSDERIAGLVETTKAQQLAYLDRIEAAWRRERSEIEANALAVGGIVEAARHKPGNAAATREALGDVYNILEKIQSFTPRLNDVSLMREFRSSVCHAKRVIDAAISAPARNCDLKECSSDDGMISAHERFCESWHDDGKTCAECPYNPRSPMITCREKWLLAPAAERK